MRIIIPGLLVWLAVYVALCAWRPIVVCHKCRGTLIRRRLVRRPRWLAWLVEQIRGVALCRRCGGAGRRIRVGRRAFDHMRRLQKAGSR